MLEILQFDFFRHALIVGFLASILCGVIGTLVVINRLVFLSGGIAHAAYGGIGLSIFFGIPFLAGTLGFTLATALVMAAITFHAKHRSDTVIGVIWAVGMALGVLFVDLTPGYHVDLMSYLFGSILTVTRIDLFVLTGTSLFVILSVGYFYHDLSSMAFDEEFARLRGVPVGGLYVFLVCMIAVAVVLIIRVVGLILVMALMTIPPFIAEGYAASLRSMMILAVALSALFTGAGLFLAFAFNLTSGAAIILAAAAGFFLSLGLKRLSLRWKKNSP
ncbi:MAG: metal ABC transporter permease [Deltaproteobacteria bacterium]|nr:metal ABC transporter permease [Deltaproteobacteria bacterium]MBW2040714.1 metal ABC transporter permease [Deltaproteobacteria bacterium]MBW2132510.1 metal ABC transporter permease [Deltaproteobacteria bacterium]